MKVRLKKTGEWIDVYKEGSAISKGGVVGVYYRFNDEYKIPIYGDELVFEKYNEGEALLYAVNKTAERTKREVINKAVEWIKSQMYIENIFEYDKDNQPVRYVCASCCDTVDDFIEKFKQAMEDEV